MIATAVQLEAARTELAVALLALKGGTTTPMQRAQLTAYMIAETRRTGSEQAALDALCRLFGAQ